jgi:hypothetical protein
MGADEDKKWEEPRQIIENGYIPGESVNVFGVPQATMQCFEVGLAFRLDAQEH